MGTPNPQVDRTKHASGRPYTGAEELRRCVAMCDAMPEDFNDKFTSSQLLQLWRAHIASDWEFLPHQWSARQRAEALSSGGGMVPRWDDSEQPIYGVA